MSSILVTKPVSNICLGDYYLPSLELPVFLGGNIVLYFGEEINQ